MQEGDGRVAGLDANLDKKIIEFLSAEFILTYIRNLQYHSEFSSPTSNGGKAKDRPSCPCSDGCRLHLHPRTIRSSYVGAASVSIPYGMGGAKGSLPPPTSLHVCRVSLHPTR
jgi:hypothetical protein